MLVAGSLLFWAGIGSTGYVAILFFQRVLHAGASAQTIAGLATGIPVFIIGIALGVPLSRWLTPMQLAIGAPLLGAVLAGVQYFDTHLWQAVVLSYIGAPFIGAYIIVMAPLLLQLLPRAGGLGERLGVLLSPFNLVSVVLAYVAAAVVDATGQLPPDLAVPGGHRPGPRRWSTPGSGTPSRRTTSPDMVKRLWEWAIVQAESMAETGIVTGLLAAPLLGVVTEEDADSAVVVDMARNILGNPYEDDEDEDADGAGLPPGRRIDGQPSVGGSLGVTGVDQVGGGPAGERENGDQKFGWGDESSSSSSRAAPLPVPDLTAACPTPGWARRTGPSVGSVTGTGGTSVTGSGTGVVSGAGRPAVRFGPAARARPAADGGSGTTGSGGDGVADRPVRSGSDGGTRRPATRPGDRSDAVGRWLGRCHRGRAGRRTADGPERRRRGGGDRHRRRLRASGAREPPALVGRAGQATASGRSATASTRSATASDDDGPPVRGAGAPIAPRAGRAGRRRCARPPPSRRRCPGSRR